MVVRSPRQQAKRERIRAAARLLFLEQGYAGTSMDAVTLEAGVSKQTVYAYYPNKRALFADVLEHASVAHPEFQALAYLEQAQPANREELEWILNEFAQRVLATMLQPEYVSLLRILIPEVRAQPELGRLFRQTVGGQALQQVAEFLDDASQRGITGPLDSDAAARLFLGSLLTYLVLDGLLAAEQPARVPDAARLRPLVGLVMNGLPLPRPG